LRRTHHGGISDLGRAAIAEMNCAAGNDVKISRRKLLDCAPPHSPKGSRQVHA